MMQNKIIGLIGGSGTGKTTFCQVAKDLGYTIIDGDKIGHEVLQNQAYDELICAFGAGILDNDKTISRKKLGSIVFSDKDKLDALNKIVHKHIEQEILSQITPKCVIDAAVLHKTNLVSICTHIVTIVASKEKKIKRIMSRDGLSYELAESRINSQPTDDEYKKLSDIVLYNDGSNEEFIENVRECLSGI